MRHLRLRFNTAIIAFALVLGVIPSTFSPVVSAQTNPLAWKAGEIIDDPVFYNGGDMNVSQVQAFLNSKVPTCDTWGTQTSEYGGGTRAQYGTAHGHAPPYICLKDYVENPSTHATNLNGVIPSGGLSAAQIIVNAAQTYSISVRALLATLQKESAGPLITDTWPFPGQYTNAMGYGCPDTAACDPQYAGFYNQVTNAARQFQLYRNYPGNYRHHPGQNNSVLYSPNSACGSSTVYIQNYSTAGLYDYTPYQPDQAALNNLYGSGDSCSAYGNRNFWRYFNDWFGTTLASPLIRGSGNTVYVLGNDSNVAYGVPSGAVLDAYGLGGLPITQVSDAYIASLNTTGMLTTLFMKPGDGTIYLADSRKAFGIASGTICTQWNLPCSSANLVSTLPASVTNNLSIQPALGNLMQHSGVVYYMENGVRHPFLKSSDVSLSSWKNESPSAINSSLNSSQTPGSPELLSNQFLRVASSGAIYYYDYSANTFFGFPTFDSFKNWSDSSLVTNDSYSNLNTTPPTALSIPDFARIGSTIYAVDGTVKLSLPTQPSASIIDSSAYPGIASLLSAKTSVAIDSDHAIRFSDGAIMMLIDDTLHPIATLTDVNLLVGNKVLNNIPNSVRSAYPVGSFEVPAGRIVKLDGGSGIYVTDDAGALWALDTMSEVNAILAWVDNGLNTSASNLNISAINHYSDLVRANGNYYAVQKNGSLRQLPATLLTTQRDSMSAPMSGPVAARFSYDTQTLKFVRFDNGMICAIQGNLLHPIGAISTYLNMGGSAENTLQIPFKTFNLFNMGDPI